MQHRFEHLIPFPIRSHRIQRLATLIVVDSVASALTLILKQPVYHRCLYFCPGQTYSLRLQ